MEQNLEGDDLIPYERAAALIGIEPKRLLGRMLRNKLGDPIGGQTPEGIMVYAWSLPVHDSALFMEREQPGTANDSSVVQGGQ